MKKVLFAVATFAAVGGTAAPAMACPGVIATMLGNCKLDDIHKALGNPLERIVGGVLESYVPGAGWVYVRMAPGVGGGS